MLASLLTPLNTCIVYLARSLSKNFIRSDGGKALATALPQTKITNLKYAATFTP